MKVLIIDDDADIRHVLKTLLDTDTVEVEEAENGAQGLKSVYSSPPNLIICDIYMPVMNGREFLKTLKTDESIRHIPVVMFTCDNTPESEFELLTNGAREYISKQSSRLVMLGRIRNVMESLEATH